MGGPHSVAWAGGGAGAGAGRGAAAAAAAGDMRGTEEGWWEELGSCCTSDLETEQLEAAVVVVAAAAAAAAGSQEIPGKSAALCVQMTRQVLER